MTRKYRIGPDLGQNSVFPIRDRTDLSNFLAYWAKKRDAAGTEGERRLCDRNWAMLFVGANTALRSSDLLRLTVGKVRFNEISQRDRKTGKENRFSLNPEVYRELTAYCRRNGLDHDGDFLFPSRKGVNRPVTRMQEYNVIKEAAEGVGIHYPVGTHTLRKTFGYWWYREYGDVVSLQSILNHGDPSITLRYIGMTRTEVDSKRKKFIVR